MSQPWMEILSRKLMLPTREGSETALVQKVRASWGRKMNPIMTVAAKEAPRVKIPRQSLRISRISPNASGVSLIPPAIPISAPRGIRLAGRRKSASTRMRIMGFTCTSASPRRHGPERMMMKVSTAIVPYLPSLSWKGMW